MKRILLIVSIIVLLTGCGKATTNNELQETDSSNKSSVHENLNKVNTLNLAYASQYQVDYYEDGYVHISVQDGTDYVIVPENKEENNLGLDNPVYIHRPSDHIYLAASSAMDLFLELDDLESISACSTKSQDYAMEEVRGAIDSGKIQYVGKYSAPDYELLLSRGCGLAIESTMISHSPKVKEQLERIGIPVFIERSSYEESPLGRLEWIKLYGVITGKEQEATSFFNRELEKIERIEAKLAASNSDLDRKTVAFFSITSTGNVTVRKPGDYICKMIEMAGGEYALNSLPIEEENALSTVNIGMEEFYSKAKDADILIYNGSIDGGVNTRQALLAKSSLLSEFKAVKEGNIWSTSLNMFQESGKIADVIVELAYLINSGEEPDGSIANDGYNTSKYLKYLE